MLYTYTVQNYPDEPEVMLDLLVYRNPGDRRCRYIQQRWMDYARIGADFWGNAAE